MTIEERGNQVARAFAESLVAHGRMDNEILAGLVAKAVGEAIAVERERCAKIVEGHEPADVYYADEDGEEYPKPVGWGTTQATLARLIRAGDTPP